MILTVICAALALLAGNARAEALINGAGATFPYPLYSKWVYEYGKITGAKINYQSIGSGSGIRQIKAKTVDFGASDAPLEFKDLEESGLMQFPAAVGGVVPVVNIKGIAPGDLKLTPGVLADIYLGKIERWDDKAIQALNPGLKLPSDSITVVRRSDGSGTTWIFTNYLSKVSAEWKDKVGFGTAVNWPAGVGGKGNEGVANYVKRIKNTIGYVELVYALQNKLTYTSLQNREKAFVQPSKESFMAAASGADWNGAPGFSVVLTDQPGKDAWPMAGATFILVHKNPQNCGNTRAVLEFFDWAYQNGAEMATALDYVPIPKNVYSIVEDAWASQIACNGEPVWKK
ncbi:MAG: phosphate ABC transporter substrate-binding protein PstS [Thermodesulfobacteriota bacterium]|nr:MAG: phosphate ABC transporter substrate-binding protein PstS [Thermodesulfobacteriota bacterium]